MTRIVIDRPHGQLHGQADGDPNGPVVCLVHALTADSSLWDEQIGALTQAGYRTIAFDLRGHGASTPVPGPYSMTMLADDVRAALGAMGVKRFHLVGLSIGGMIAQALATTWPECLLSLTLSSTLPKAAGNATETWRPRIALVQEQGSVAALIPSTMERWLSVSFQDQNPQRSQAIADGIGKTSIEGFLGCVAALQEFDFTESLTKIAIPTLVLCGSDDASAPPAANRQIATLIPNARYVEIQDALHLVNVDKAAEFNNLLVNWLEKHAAVA